jgi:hypothetical protein
MYRELLKSLDGLHVLSTIGMLMFLGIFVLVVIRAVSRRKSDVNQWSQLPLEDAPVIQDRNQPQARTQGH